jgi:hypothetical protein
MAQLIVAAAGAAIGGTAISGGILTAAGALTFGAQVGWIAGSMLGASLGKKNQVAAQLSDLRVTGGGYGQVVPWVAGSPRVAGQMVWAGKRRAIANTQRVGKGGGSKVTNWTYEVDVLYKLSENPITGVSRIWLNGELVYGEGATKSGVWDEIRIYSGADDQMPDPTYEAHVGAGNAPANRGCGSVVIVGLKLGGGGQIPNITIEIGEDSSTPTDSGEYFFVDFEGSQPTDKACFSRLAQFSAMVNTTYSIAGNKAVVDVNGWLFDDNVTRGVFFRLNATPSTILPVVYDFVFSASTAASGPTQASSVRIIYLSPSSANANSTYSFLIRATFNSSGLVTSLVLNCLFLGERTYTLPSPSAGPFRCTVFIEPAIPRTRFYVDEQLIGTYTDVPPNLVDSDEILLGGSTNASDKTGTIKATVEYDLVRIISNPPAELVPLTEPVCEILVIGQKVVKPLREVVDDLMGRCEIDASNWDSSGIPSEPEYLVRAIYLSQIAPIRSALESLAQAYGLTWSKSDKIYFRLRGQAPAGTWPWADLGMSDDPGGSDNPLPIRRGNDSELPAQVVLAYNNMAADFNPGTETSEILPTGQASIAQLQLPIGMLPSQAKGVANALLREQAAGLTTFGPVRVPLSYAKYEPGDTVLIEDQTGRLHPVLLMKKTDMGLTLEFEGRMDDVASVPVPGVADDTDTGQTVVLQPGGTAWLALDLPMLRDADNNPGWYVVIGSDGTGDYWPGASLFRSWDDVTYSLLADVNQGGTFGTVDGVLPAWAGGNSVDFAHRVEVLVNNELSSSNLPAMLADLTINTACLGVNGRWEVLRFIRADFLGAEGGMRRYRLSGLLRGFRGTDWAMGLHEDGDNFVLLDTAVLRFGSEAAQIGLPRYIKAVTFGLPLSDVAGELFTDTGTNLRPFSPVDLVAERDDDDVLLSWNRRTRGSWRFLTPAVEPPLLELAEVYDVEVWDAGFSNLLNTYISTSPSYTYTAAQQTADYGAPADPVYIRIRQRSAIVGAGYAAEGTL